MPSTRAGLQLRGALEAAETLLQQLLAASPQADRYRDTVMPGRTWMQHALPVTFGLKLAGTLDALLRWQQRLREMRPRCWCCSLAARRAPGRAKSRAAVGRRWRRSSV
jgi:adenylosuccinate lyase